MAAAIVDILIVILSFMFLVMEVRGAVYFKQHVYQLYSAEVPRWQKFKQIVKFLWNNLSYFHYLFTLILSILSLFNPFFDALLLIVELNRRS